MKITIYLIIIFFSFSVTCFSQSENTYLNRALYYYNLAEYEKAIVVYKNFIKDYPYSERVLSAYIQVSGIYFDNLKNYLEAINTYKEIAEKFPLSHEAKQSLFLIAFVYDESLKDKENAIKAYKYFLQKYPNEVEGDKMVQSAKNMLILLESE